METGADTEFGVAMETENNPESTCIKTMKQRISCQLCGKEFSQLDKLSYHIYNNCREESDQTLHQTEHSDNGDFDDKMSFVVKTENENSVDDGIMNSEASDQIGKHVCDLCGKQFHKLQNLQVHVRSHTGEKPYSCQQCDKTFTSYGNLKAHSRVHTGIRPHQCTVCGKEFGTAQNLQVHFRTHTGEKPYTCNVCGKGFAGQGNLKVHQRTHTGEKPYKCQVCGKDFRNLQSLHIHVRSHTGEKPYECNVCHKAFSSQGNMQVHMRVHTGERPFTCEQCDKNFTNLQALKLHIRTHTGEKPHVCQVCEKDFASLGNLQVHMRSHTGTRPYSCRMCGKDFTTMSNMQAHVVRTHASELYAENTLLWNKMQMLSRQYMEMASNHPGEESSQENTFASLASLNPGLPSPLGLSQFGDQNLMSKSAAASVGESIKSAMSTEQEETKGSLTKDTLSDSDEGTNDSTKLVIDSEAPQSSEKENDDVTNVANFALFTNMKTEDNSPNAKTCSSDSQSSDSAGGVGKFPSFSEYSKYDMVAVKSEFDRSRMQSCSATNHSIDKSISRISTFGRLESSAGVDEPVADTFDSFEQSKTGPRHSASSTYTCPTVNPAIPQCSNSGQSLIQDALPLINPPGLRTQESPSMLDSTPFSADTRASNTDSKTCYSNSETSISDPRSYNSGALSTDPRIYSLSSMVSSSQASTHGLTSSGSNPFLTNPALTSGKTDPMSLATPDIGGNCQPQDFMPGHRSMLHGFQFPPVKYSSYTNHPSLNTYKVSEPLPTKQTKSNILTPRDITGNLFGMMNSSRFPPTSNHSTSHFLNAFTHGAVGNYGFPSTSRSSADFSDSPNAGDLNSIVQTALNMYMEEKGQGPHYPAMEERQETLDEGTSFRGSGGPVFPTNI